MQFTKPIQVWLHKSLDEDGEAGYHAWVFPYLGFATWAETEPHVLEKIPQKLLDYLQFRQQHDLPPQDVPSPSGQTQVEVVERVTGNEILFSPDYQAATPRVVDETIALLHATRTELLEAISELADEVLDWDPPYRRFPSWARGARFVRFWLTLLIPRLTTIYPALVFRPTFRLLPRMRRGRRICLAIEK